MIRTSGRDHVSFGSGTADQKMSYAFNTWKAIEAAATLLRHAPDKVMGKKRLLAFLYLADLQSLKETGRPIIGGRLVAMQHGAIHSHALNLIDGVYNNDEPEWPQRFDVHGFNITLKDDPGSRNLSRYEIDLLTEIQKKYVGYDDFEVAKDTHGIEWRSNYREGTSTTIPFEQVIDAIGRKNDKQRILQLAEEVKFYDSMFPEKPIE
jgi:uncharacterized phage-associated protein